MSEREKKLFAQLDDSMVGQRTNALEMLHKHDEEHKTSFRERLAKIERGAQYDALEQEAVALRQRTALLDAELTRWKAAVGEWQHYAEEQKRKLATAEKLRRKRVVGPRTGWFFVSNAGVLAIALAWHVGVHCGPSTASGCRNGAPAGQQTAGEAKGADYSSADNRPLRRRRQDRPAHRAEAGNDPPAAKNSSDAADRAEVARLNRAELERVTGTESQ
jgi:hypothetical protein